MRAHTLRRSLNLLACAVLFTSANVNAQTPDIPIERPRPPPESKPEPEESVEAPVEPEPVDEEPVVAPPSRRAAPAAAASNEPLPASKRENRHRLAPSITGEAGLLRVAAAEGFEPKSVRIGFGLNFFSAGNVFREGDSASRVAGVLSVSAAPIEHLELWLNTRAQSTRSDLTRPELLQSLGDLSLGLKGFYTFGEGAFTAGADLQLTLLTGIGSQSFDFGASQFQARALTTVDFSKTSMDVPIRFHANLGGLVDASDNLAADALSDPERFAHGSSAFHRLLAGFAVEVPVKYITPYLEYTMEIPLGYLATPGLVVAGATASGLRQAQTDPSQSVASAAARPPLQRVMPQRITPGVRVTAIRDLTIDLAVEIGLTPDTGPGMVAVPPYEVFMLFSYALDPWADRGPSGPPLAVPVLVPEPTPTEPPPSSGLVTGVVMNSSDGKAIEGVVVTFDRAPPVATANNGRFLSHEIEPGPVKITAKKEGFESTSADLQVEIGQTQELKLTMVPAIREGSVRGRVTDPQGNGISGASLQITGASAASVSSNASGGFEQSLVEGDYVVVVDANGFYRTGRKIKIEKGKSVDLDLRVKPRATPPVAEVVGNQIKLKKKVGFNADGTLMPAAADILDAVADLMWARPELKIRVESHFDNSVGETEAMSKTQVRAESVTGYLAAQGIGTERLAAAGLGGSRPVAPNMTQRGRDTNKRIELVIVKE